MQVDEDDKPTPQPKDLDWQNQVLEDEGPGIPTDVTAEEWEQVMSRPGRVRAEWEDMDVEERLNRYPHYIDEI